MRVTPNGAKAFVFEQSLKNRTIRRTIGSVDAWSIEKARAEAAKLLAGLPRRNGWVLSSAQALAGDAKNAARRARYHASRGSNAPEGDVSIGSASGRLVDPSIAHRRACAAAGLEGLTLHGLRRSFASLCECLDIPGGVSAQIQGHAPQGVREQNYIRRPLDLLRGHHEKIEAWILKEAGIDFDPAKAATAGLCVVA